MVIQETKPVGPSNYGIDCDSDDHLTNDADELPQNRQ